MNKKFILNMLLLLGSCSFTLLGCGHDTGQAPSLTTSGDGGETTPTPTPSPSPAPAVCGSGGDCRMFVTNDSTYTDGALGSTSSLDSACNSDSRKPSTGTYKALVMRSSRQPGNNWILYASQRYTRPNGTLIGTTTATSIFSGVLNAPVVPQGTDVMWFTGITITGSSWGYVPGNTCNNYASNTSAHKMAYGIGVNNSLESNFGYDSSGNSGDSRVLCDGSDFSTVANQVGLLCVEQ